MTASIVQFPSRGPATVRHDREPLTQGRLHQLLNYDAETGIFTFRHSTPRRKAGDVVGGPHPKGYLCASLDRRTYLLHRLAWLYVNGAWPDKIDHINGVRTDNRISNLRDVDCVANGRNVKLYRSRYGAFGIRPCGKKWRAEICVSQKNIQIGMFETRELAIAVRRRAEREYGFHENHGRAM